MLVCIRAGMGWQFYSAMGQEPGDYSGSVKAGPAPGIRHLHGDGACLAWIGPTGVRTGCRQDCEAVGLELPLNRSPLWRGPGETGPLPHLSPWYIYVLMMYIQAEASCISMHVDTVSRKEKEAANGRKEKYDKEETPITTDTSKHRVW